MRKQCKHVSFGLLYTSYQNLNIKICFLTDTKLFIIVALLVK